MRKTGDSEGAGDFRGPVGARVVHDHELIHESSGNFVDGPGERLRGVVGGENNHQVLA
jgi:hypothetical protein